MASNNGGKRRGQSTTEDHHGVEEEEEEGRDWLSSLPDNLLIEIISLLPIDTAAATSALSRRWAHLWTHLTRLWLYKLDLHTVDHILRQLTSPKIHLLQLDPPDDDVDTVFSVVDSCLAHVRHRNVEEIELLFPGVDELPRFSMPCWVFSECRSLVVLKLVLLRVDDSELPPAFNLPNLKRLELILGDDNGNLMRTLFRSCPILEDLRLEFELFEVGHFVDISSPRLKNLYLRMIYPRRCKFVINAPALLYFEVHGFYDSTSCYFVDNPTMLLKAEIYLENEEQPCLVADEEDEDCKDVRVSNFIQGISNVRYLELNDGIEIFSYLGSLNDDALPIFHNLTYLDTTFDKSLYWKDFLPSLRCFPNLEVLKVSRYSNTQENDNAFRSLFPTMLGKLKWMEITSLQGYDYELALLEYFLCNASIMARLSVYASIKGEQKEVRLWKECEFCKKLFKLPRSSSTCEIKFHGDRIKASSNDVKNGLLTCQIED